MRRSGRRSLIFGTFALLFVAGWWWLRTRGAVAGPREYFGDAFVTAIPLAHLLFGYLMLRAANNEERPARTERLLATRFSNGDVESGGGYGPFFVWATTFTFTLVFLFFFALYPRTWDESWDCATCDDGDGTCCNVNGPWYATALFVVGVIAGPLWVLGGPVAGIAGLRYLRRRIRMPAPITEIETNRVKPGGKLRLVVRLFGNRAYERVVVRIECEEQASFEQGSSRSTHREIVYRNTAADRTDARAIGDAPFVLSIEPAIPTTAMHSFSAKNNTIAWQIVLEVTADGSTTTNQYIFNVDPE